MHWLSIPREQNTMHWLPISGKDSTTWTLGKTIAMTTTKNKSPNNTFANWILVSELLRKIQCSEVLGRTMLYSHREDRVRSTSVVGIGLLSMCLCQWVPPSSSWPPCIHPVLQKDTLSLPFREQIEEWSWPEAVLCMCLSRTKGLKQRKIFPYRGYSPA